MRRTMALGAAALLLGACSEQLAEEEPATLPPNLPAELASERMPVEIVEANCLLWPSNFRGPCRFEPRGRGSFSVSRPEGEAFYGEVTELVVSVFQEGRADVRALTASGGSLMVGEAARSQDYPACWIGSGFSVCAY